ncbi:MAG: 50S ribosomal protein L11 methyltransferase [Gammaproteobacteria bacterium]|nr:MAG: 50S ribosomal protein L11 methyltransferase [Gammaproteobacteria bacterium]
MPFHELVIELGATECAAAEAACFAAGAFSVTLTDAADEPLLEPPPGANPLWQKLRLTALFPATAVPERLAGEVAAALGLDPGKVRSQPVADRAWEREWLRDFRPMRFGRRLWVCPGGQPAGDPEAVVLELDPGLAFGTGTHATTALCLEWLDRTALSGQRLLDYGCGSGILALAALRLGAAEAWAFDIDPQALLATSDNAERNGLRDRLRIAVDAGDLPGGFDLAVANILAGPLIELAPVLAGQCRPGAALLLAGLLDDQAAEVAVAYRPWFDIVREGGREGWTVLAGCRHRN